MVKKINIPEDLLNSYLFAGYDLRPKYPLRLLESECFESTLHRYDPNGVGVVFDKILDRIFSENTFDECLIPLSGGWDSRLLLGGALERLESHKIKAVTFGSSGQTDFEIGRKVAREFGVAHLPVDLSIVPMDWDALVRHARNVPWVYFPDAFYNHYSYSELIANSQPNSIMLSGFMGGPVTGSHQPKNTEFSAVEMFLNKQRRSRSVKLERPNFSLESLFQGIQGIDQSDLFHTLDFSIRQAQGLAPVTTPRKKLCEYASYAGTWERGCKVFTPFADKTWVEYWKFAPPECKKNQKLYLEFMEYKFPDLMSYASKGTFANPFLNNYFVDFSVRLSYKVRESLHAKFPLFRFRNWRNDNYINYQEAFFSRKDYADLLDNAQAIIEREDIIPWIDIGKFKREHLKGKYDHSAIFLILIGLALNFSASNEK